MRFGTAPAAGDQRVTGPSSEAKLSYTKDGIPTVRSGPECRAGKAAKRAHAQLDESDYWPRFWTGAGVRLALRGAGSAGAPARGAL